MTRRKNGQGEYTIQADVGPGDKTGIYYITFCNLPFDTSWQQLKDWLRPVCKVDHVAVFEKSTSGWVRVSGKENFENAWKLLDGGVFHGRSIIASDRNRTETIKIKSMLDFSTGPTRDRQRAGAGPLTQPATPTAPYSPIPSLETTSHHADGMYTHPPAMGSYPGVYPPDIDRAGGYAAPPMPQYHVAMPGPVPVAAHGVVQYTGFPEWPQGRTSYQGKHRASDHGFASSVSEAYTTTKPTTIYVKNLARRISAKEIDHWIRRKVKNDAIGIAGIDVPVDDKGGNLGSAFVRLNNQIDPKHIVKSLHHVNYRGRTVSAWVVHDEDVKRSKGPPSEPRATRKHREGKAPADDKQDSQKHCRHGSSSVKAPSNDIVVAQGSSQKGKTKAP